MQAKLSLGPFPVPDETLPAFTKRAEVPLGIISRYSEAGFRGRFQFLNHYFSVPPSTVAISPSRLNKAFNVIEATQEARILETTPVAANNVDARAAEVHLPSTPEAP